MPENLSVPDKSIPQIESDKKKKIRLKTNKNIN